MGCLLVNAGILPEHTCTFSEDFVEVGIIVIKFALGFEESSVAFVVMDITWVRDHIINAERKA